jgi:hypothetical protein
MTGRSEAPYVEAQRELELYFGAADGILGLHSIGFESSGHIVWDSLRIHRAHVAPRMISHRQSLDRLALAAETVRMLSSRMWTDAMVTFTPRRWPERLQAELSRGARGGSLVGLALIGDALRRAWEKREGAAREAACRALLKAGDLDATIDLALLPLTTRPFALLAFAAAEAERTDKGRVSSFFKPIRAEGERRLDATLAAYERLRRARRWRDVERARREAGA